MMARLVSVEDVDRLQAEVKRLKVGRHDVELVLKTVIRMATTMLWQAKETKRGLREVRLEPMVFLGSTRRLCKYD